MDFYPDTIVISGKEYKAQRSAVSGTVLLPYKDEPAVKAGDVIMQQMDNQQISLRVLDASFRRIGTFNSSIKNPHMLTMKVEVVDGATQQSAPPSGADSGNLQPANVTEEVKPITIGFAELMEKILASDDGEAKDSLSKLLKNPTVKGFLGR